MDKRNHDEERRNARRFEVSWEVAVKRSDPGGKSFDEMGTLENLSSHGAFLHLPRCVNPGERFELRVKLPFRRSNWITYKAEVVRVEQVSTLAGVAVKFDSSRPVFTQQ